VSILPGGASAAAQHGANLGNKNQLVRGAVSEDGSRVFFETESHHLFVRDVAGGVTVQLDVAAAGAVGGVAPAVFQGASGDGGVVFFKDAARLTVDATAKPSEPDLYVCELALVASGEEDCSRHLRDLSVDVNAGEAGDVLGAAIGFSSDGSFAYFVANGVLGNGGVAVAGAVRGDCVAVVGSQETLAAADRSCDLYVWHDGVLGLVGVLSNADAPDWQAGVFGTELSLLSARVSADGEWLAFMSQRSLTGFDNRDVASGVRDEEVFEYSAQSGRVVCVSCDASGARPTGVLEPNVNEPPLLVDRRDVWGEQWVAGSVPGWTSVGPSALYQSRYLGDDGRLFFDSPVGLVAGDGNGQWDVYEFEPEGVGGCSSGLGSSRAVFVGVVSGSRVDGCVGLVSSGQSSEESVFLDASVSGDDVFFLTAAKLVPADFDDALDVYDAHVCGVGWACPPEGSVLPPACSNADSCRGVSAPSPEVLSGVPASATFSGGGNFAPVPAAVPVKKTLAQLRAKELAGALKACRKKRVRSRRLVCERVARKRFGSAIKAARKASGAGGRR
jgi:hypothetical protein